ncbi:unnamed protein product [Prunus armeniaca]|uniref:Sulfotransferase n=1 Tax=Prunus armeniaca TaxID=36596 RepID=A0A6J5XF48_PRUAR|nr:unnamed protein product [Prunus armeniaca]
MLKPFLPIHSITKNRPRRHGRPGLVWAVLGGSRRRYAVLGARSSNMYYFPCSGVSGKRQPIPDQVVFMKYEDMKMDTMQHVKRLAEFVGHPFSLEEERQGVVQEIINLCSSQNSSNLEVNKSGAYHVHIASQTGQTPLLVHNSAFFRRGEVGDSKNHLTVEMLEQILTKSQRKSWVLLV